MYERFTDSARKVFQIANQTAQRFNHEYVGVKHVLIALTKEDGVATKILNDLGVDPAKIRTEMESRMQSGSSTAAATMGKLPQTPRVKELVGFAVEAADVLGSTYVGTEHILLGLKRITEESAVEVLRMLPSISDVREACQKFYKQVENLPLEPRRFGALPTDGGTTTVAQAIMAHTAQGKDTATALLQIADAIQELAKAVGNLKN